MSPAQQTMQTELRKAARKGGAGQLSKSTLKWKFF